MRTKNFYIHLHLIGKIVLRQGVYTLSASLPTPSLGLRAKALPFSEASNGTPIGEATRTASALPAALPGVLPTSNPCNTNRMKGLFGLSFRSKDRSRRSCDICPTHRFQVGGKTSTKSLWPSGKSFAVCLFGRRPLAYSVVFSDSEESRTKFGATKFSNNKEFIVRLNETLATTSPSTEFLLFSKDSRPTVEDFRCEAPSPGTSAAARSSRAAAHVESEIPAVCGLGKSLETFQDFSRCYTLCLRHPASGDDAQPVLRVGPSPAPTAAPELGPPTDKSQPKPIRKRKKLPRLSLANAFRRFEFPDRLLIERTTKQRSKHRNPNRILIEITSKRSRTIPILDFINETLTNSDLRSNSNNECKSFEIKRTSSSNSKSRIFFRLNHVVNTHNQSSAFPSHIADKRRFNLPHEEEPFTEPRSARLVLTYTGAHK